MIRIVIGIFLLASWQPMRGQDTSRVSLLFAGDVMQHDSQIAAAYDVQRVQYDYSQCFQFVRPVVETADIAIANLEGTLAGPPYKGYPEFSAPDALAAGLKDSGFDVLVTANNHSVDRRRQGLERTIDVLDSLEIKHTGTFRDSSSRAVSYPLIIEANQIRFSLLNYTYGTNGISVSRPNVVNLIDTAQIKIDMGMALSQKADAIIVFMHWGSEYRDNPDSDQRALADFCFKHGATLVIGSHPHVLQPMEWRKDQNKLVAYSLGNFVSGQQSRYRDGGALLRVEFERVQTDSISHVRIADAAYELVWVYRNVESPKKYFILPIREFEQDSIMIREKSAILNFKQFAGDSRKLFSRNMNIREHDRAPIESSYYKILLPEGFAASAGSDSSSVLNFYGIYPETKTDHVTRWVTGKFFDREIAEQALWEVRSQTIYKDAKLIWHYWGKETEILPSRKQYTK